MENGGVLSGSEDHFKRELDIVLKEADELKEEGNSAFRSGNYSKAVEVYTRSLERVFAARESVERHQEHERHQALRRNNSGSVSETPLLLPADEERISLASAAHTLRAHGLEGSATSRRCGPPETSQATAARKGEETGDSLKHHTDKDLKTQLDLLQQRVLCNRALCYLRLQAFDLAEADCTEVLILEPSNAKALYRRACAYEEQQRFVECLTDLQMLLQCGQGPGTEPADRRQQEQMVCRVRDKLLREEKHQQEMQQPRALMAAALSADENCAPEERVADVRKAVALLHRNPAMRKRFLRDGSLLAVSEYLASAPVPQQQKDGEGADGDRGGHERGSEEESFVEGDLAPLSPALEAACWELLLRCVVDEAAEEQSQQQEADRRAASGGGGSTAGERGQTTRQPQNQERGCLGLLRQQWSSEQLLLRLRRLLRAGATTTTRRWQQGQQQSRPQGSLISSRSGEGNSSGLGPSSFSTAALRGRGARASSVAARKVPEAAATAAGGPVGSHNTQRRQNESSEVGLRTEEKEEQAAAQARMEACCYLLQLMGKLEQLSAHFFEDDAAFCTACLVGMQQTNCLNIQLAAVDAATTAATCRRKLGLQQAPALALRQNIEKWLEELLQLLADLQPHAVSAQLAQQQAVQQAEAKLQEEGDFLSRKEGEDMRRRDVGCTRLGSRDSSKRDRLEAQVECLLVTLVGLLVDKVRALPPLFAAARRSSSSGREWHIGAQTKQQRAAAAATAEAADVSRLLEQLLAPYLPLSSSSMFLDNRSSDGAADCVRTVLDSLDGCRGTQEKEGEEKKQEGVARNSSSSSIRVLDLGSGLAERRDADVEETVTHQIVGLKVLRLLLPAAREEISQFLIADMCGVFRFAVAAAADDVRVRLPHTPRLLWLQQQAAAAQLLAPAMDFPELRHRLLQADGLQSLTVVLSKCCNSLRSTRLNGSTWGVSPSTAASMETAMRWVMCGKIAAVLARLAVHHEEVRVQVFDLVDFIKVLDLLLQRWEEQQQLLLQQEEQQVVEDVEERGVLLGERREAAGGAAAAVGGRGGGRNVPAAVAAVQQGNEACQDFAEVFCFVSLHASFKERLANDDEGLLQRLLRQVNAAFGPAGDRSAICRSRRRGDAGRRNSGSRSGNSGNRNLVLLLLLQGLCNLMRSRDDRQRRPSSRRPGFLPGDAGGGPQLDEEQQEQLQHFFEQLPPEAQPPRNGQIDAGGKEIAGALQARLVSYGVVHVVASIVLASLRAAAAAQQEEERQRMRRRTHSSSNFHSGGGMTVALQLEQHLSPNALVAAADALAALAAKPIYRGNVVREGGLRALLGIITFLQKQVDGSFSYEAEQRDARQALARLCVSVNPSLITYQEMHEAIGYVIPLLRDGHELLQYEAALAITNLTSSGAEAQAHAWHAGAWDDLEELLFSDNPLLRAAGLEGWCNLADSVVVQRAIGERCDRLWQAEARRATLAAAGQARGSRTRGEGDEEEAEEEEGNTSRRDGVVGTSQSLWDGDFARDQFEVQCLKILLAYCLEDENVRARHAAIAALAMLVTDPRTAAAAVRCSNFSNLCLCLDQAHLDTNADAENMNRYTGDSLILRVVATINHLWVSLRDSDSRHCCDFDGLTLQLQDTLFRNKHKLKGVAFDLAQELSV